MAERNKKFLAKARVNGNLISGERVVQVRELNEFDENSNQDHDDSFAFAISPVATFVQFLALVPVCGVSQDDPQKFNFKLRSFRMIYTLLHISYGFTVSSLMFRFIYGEGISAKNIGALT